MTQQEIKDKIKGLQKAIEAAEDRKNSFEKELSKEKDSDKISDLNDNIVAQKSRIKSFNTGIDKLESKLEKELDIKPAAKKKTAKKAKAKTISRKSKAKTKPEKNIDTESVETHGHVSQPKTQSKITPKPKPPKKVKITKKDIVKQAIETQVEQKPVKKTLIIKKKQKEEKHVIDTAFGKDIEGAILSLNKERFIIREQKNRKTGEVETVKHSQEYRNSHAIQNKVDRMFNSSIADIAEKDKTKKKEIENLAKELRDIHVLWLNEIDIIISNGEIDDMKNIKKMLIGLLKEARKNDEDNKWRNAAGLEALAKKYL
jgi:hypothetical protein